VLWTLAFIALPLAKPRWRLKVHGDASNNASSGETCPLLIEVLPTRRGPYLGLHFDAQFELSSLQSRADAPYFIENEIDASRTTSTRLHLSLCCPRRGVYNLSSLAIENARPFGLLRARQIVKVAQRVV
ncbi:hypothetical protein, partial [Escherichia coli]|uniref:hypothetical protein n=1 Tax=Escherichia coli TaxID=562 RepID=UPI0022AC4F70